MPVLEAPTSPANPSATPAAPPASAAPGDQSQPNPPAATPARPEGLPERYWDPTTGYRQDDVVASLSAFEAEQAKRAETFKDFPDKPEDAAKFYKLPETMLPEGVKLPDGVKFEPNTDLLTRALPVLHKHKADPALFTELTQAFNAYELDRFTKAQTDFAEDGKKLGANGETRRKDLADRIAARVGPERAKFMDARIISADAVEFFEALLKDGNTAPPLPGRNDPPPPAPQPLEKRWYS